MKLQVIEFKSPHRKNFKNSKKGQLKERFLMK